MKNPKLVFKQEFCSLDIARNVERKIKKLKRKDYIEKIISEGYVRMTPTQGRGSDLRDVGIDKLPS